MDQEAESKQPKPVHPKEVDLFAKIDAVLEPSPIPRHFAEEVRPIGRVALTQEESI